MFVSSTHILQRRLLSAAIAALLAAGAHSHESSIQPALVRQGGLVDVDVDGHSGLLDVAHYSLIMAIPRNYFDNVTTLPSATGTAWDAIHDLNPAAKILVYQGGPISRDDTASEQYAVDLNTVSRWNLDRGYSTLYSHPSWILSCTVGGVTGRCRVDSHSPPSYWLDFGSTDFMDYWAHATINDMLYRTDAWPSGSTELDTTPINTARPWKSDGLFVDVVSAFPQNDVQVNTTYTSNAAWQTAMLAYTAGVSTRIRASYPDQLMYFNVTFSQNPVGKTYWASLDQLTTGRPDGALEEGAFAVNWGTGDTSFYTDAQWKNQVDTLAATQNMNAIFESHTKTAQDSTGTDNYGNATSYWDAVWFSLSSYLIGKNEVNNNSYFNFWRDPDFSYFDEYDLDIGRAVSTYTTQAVAATDASTISIYAREFDKGWVFVNPSAKNSVAFALPDAGKPLDHATFLSPIDIVNASTLSLPAHRGVVVLKDPVIGDWHLDESTGTTAADAHEFLPGHTLYGTTHGSPTWLPTGGVLGGALQFDGSDDYIDVAHDTGRLAAAQQLTISYWVKPDAAATGASATVLQFGVEGQHGLRVRAGSDWNEFALDAFSTSGTQTIVKKPLQGKLSTTAWTHLAVTIDNKAGGVVNTYRNGQLLASDTLLHALNLDPADTLYIGKGVTGSGSTFWAGKLDDVKIQSKALNAYEVAAAYRAQVADWRFDEPKYRLRAFDSFGSAHGRLGGNPVWLGAGGSGAPAGAIQFDGSDDYVLVDDNAAQLETPQQLTINTWVQPASDTPSSAILVYGDLSTGWYMYAGPGANEVGITLIDSSGHGTDYFANPVTPLTLSTSSWTRLTLTIDNQAGGAIKLYVNGAAVPLTASTLAAPFATAPASSLYMGIGPFAGWKGKLGHVQLFGRALNSAEVLQLSN